VQAGVEPPTSRKVQAMFGVTRLPVSVAVEPRHAADLLVEQRR